MGLPGMIMVILKIEQTTANIYEFNMNLLTLSKVQVTSAKFRVLNFAHIRYTQKL